MIELKSANGAKEARIKLVRIVLHGYLVQASIGFAVGLTIPWLRLFGVIR